MLVMVTMSWCLSSLALRLLGCNCWQIAHVTALPCSSCFFSWGRSMRERDRDRDSVTFKLVFLLPLLLLFQTSHPGTSSPESRTCSLTHKDHPGDFIFLFYGFVLSHRVCECFAAYTLNVMLISPGSFISYFKRIAYNNPPIQSTPGIENKL